MYTGEMQRETTASSQTVDAKTLARAFPELFSDETLDVVSLAGDVSTRRYFRVGTGKESFILQEADAFASAADHPFLSMRSLLESWNVRVPGFRGADGARGWILLEDLGDEMLQQHPTEALYADAIHALLTWSRRSLSTPASTVHFRQAFDVEKLQFEMNFAETHLVHGVFGRSNFPLATWARSNSMWLDARPRVLCHRDYHSRNIMVFRGELVVIDFQDARMGPATYDVVSLLWDPYVPLAEALRTKLLRQWHADASRVSPAFARGAFDDPSADWRIELERMKLQRLIKATGTYGNFYRNRGRKDYLNCVRPAVNDAIASLVHLESVGVATPDDLRLRAGLESLDLNVTDRLFREAV